MSLFITSDVVDLNSSVIPGAESEIFPHPLRVAISPSKVLLTSEREGRLTVWITSEKRRLLLATSITVIIHNTYLNLFAYQIIEQGLVI